jgi:eukaryotic-like serine/threonine-protein kinase
MGDSTQNPTGGEKLRPGMIVRGKFALISQIGAGGTGVVFEAEDTWIGRRVALKVLHPHVAADPAAARLIRREARATARIHHPNIVAVHEVGQRTDGSFYVVQELLHGASLRQQLEARGRLRPMEAIEIVLPILGALCAAHDVAVVHCDLKPDNIFLARTPSGDVVPKLIDFGIATALRKVNDTTRWDASQTMDSRQLGTPCYMSPEQARGERVDVQTDIWAMGTVLFELLAGTCPFEAPTALAILARLLTEPVPRLDAVAPDVPVELARIVHWTLERDMGRRCRSIRSSTSASATTRRSASGSGDRSRSRANRWRSSSTSATTPR